MAVDMTKLNPEQEKMVKKIIDSGKNIGAPDIVIQAAIFIANAESNFDPNQNINLYSSAKGMFQYIENTWETSWNNYIKNNTLDPLTRLSASNARFIPDAQIAIMYQDLIHWYSGYPQGMLARNYMPGGNLYDQTQKLENNGIDIKNNFINYAYFRHNTNVD